MKLVQVGLIMAVCVALVVSISIENELGERKKGKGKKPGKKPVKPPAGGKGGGGKGTGSGGKGTESVGDWLDVWEHFGELKDLLMAMEAGSSGCNSRCNNGTCADLQCECCGDFCCPLNWHCGCFGCWNPAWGPGPKCPSVCTSQGECLDENSCGPNQQCCFRPGGFIGECYSDECPCEYCDSDSQCPGDEICCPSLTIDGPTHCADICPADNTAISVEEKQCRLDVSSCLDGGGVCSVGGIDGDGYCCPEGTPSQYCCVLEVNFCHFLETSTATPGSGKGKPGKGKGGKGGKGGKKAKGKGR